MTIELLNPDTKVIYIAIPKTASSSIAKMFAGDGHIGPDHKTYYEIVPRLEPLGLDPKDIYWVVSVRHPYTRFESWAYDVDMRSQRNFGFNWMEKGMTIDDLVEYVAEHVVVDDNGVTFLAPNPKAEKGRLPMYGSHIQPQCHFIERKGEYAKLKGIIRFENMKEDFHRVSAEIEQRLGIKGPKWGYGERANGKTLLKSTERPPLSEASKKILYDLYRPDFIAFEYER